MTILAWAIWLGKAMGVVVALAFVVGVVVGMTVDVVGPPAWLRRLVFVRRKNQWTS